MRHIEEGIQLLNLRLQIRSVCGIFSWLKWTLPGGSLVSLPVFDSVVLSTAC